MISIVANFYKSEKYIKTLVKSVLNQTYKDWELICVNDCSPGKDSEILHSFAEKDSRIRVIDNPVNLGISRAKKVGIDAARGEYITFIDGDDYFAPEALERLYRAATDFRVDVVAMRGYKFLPFHFKDQLLDHGVDNSFRNRPIENPELFDECFVNFFGKFKFGVAYWGKLYKTTIVKNLPFDYPDAHHSAGEDYKFQLCLFQHISSMAFIDYEGYFWRWGGITSGKKNDDWSTENFVKIHLNFHLEKKRLLDKYKYHKGYRWLYIELKNIILSGIAQMLLTTHDSDKIEQTIDCILSHQSIKDLESLCKDTNCNDSTFISYILNNQIPQIIEYCNNYNKSHKIKRCIKQFILSFISIFK